MDRRFYGIRPVSFIARKFYGDEYVPCRRQWHRFEGDACQDIRGATISRKQAAQFLSEFGLSVR